MLFKMFSWFKRKFVLGNRKKEAAFDQSNPFLIL